jgi:hypothetical protein
MTIELLTPVNTRKGEITDLARKRYRKNILPLTKIRWKGKEKTFDLSYMQRVKDAFDKGAFPYVPVKLAPADNSHTNDVLRTGGRVVGLSVSEEEGLVADLELNDDGIKAVQSSDGHVPVSAKILEQLVRDDGDFAEFDAALAHVLVVDDPYVRGMTPWKDLDAVSLSENRAESITEIIDLSAEHIGDSEEKMTDSKQTVTLSVTPDQAARLIELPNEDKELEDLGLKAEDFEDESEEAEEGTGEQPSTENQLTDPAAGQRNLPGDNPGTGAEGGNTGQEGGVQLSRQQTSAVELARAEAAAARAETLSLSRQLAEAGIEREVTEFQRKGLAPAILNLARPLLSQVDTLELSRDGKSFTSSPAEIMRDVLNEVIELAKTGHDVVDFEKLSGVLIEDDDTLNTRTDAQLAELSRVFD